MLKENFYENNGFIYCEKDFDNLFLKKCENCGIISVYLKNNFW